MGKKPAQQDVVELFKLLKLETEDRDIAPMGPMLAPSDSQPREYRVVLTNGTGSQTLGMTYAELE